MTRRTPAVLLLAVVLAACGASAREKTIASTTAALKTAAVLFERFDSDHQTAIVKAAQTPDEGKAALQVYRERRAPVLRAFELAYQALGLAVVIDSDASLLVKAVAAATAAQQAFVVLKGSAP